MSSISFDPYAFGRRLLTDGNTNRPDLTNHQIDELFEILFVEHYTNGKIYFVENIESLDDFYRTVDMCLETPRHKYRMMASCGYPFNEVDFVDISENWSTFINGITDNSVYHGHLEIAEGLIEFDTRGLCAADRIVRLDQLLRIAAHGGQLVLFKFLIGLGAVFTGSFAIVDAVVYGGNVELFKLMPEQDDDHLNRLLETAATVGKIEMFHHLLSLFSDPGVIGWTNKIVNASMYVHLDILKFIIENFEISDQDKKQGLTVAIDACEVQSIDYFFDLGVRLSPERHDDYDRDDSGFVHYTNRLNSVQ